RPDERLARPAHRCVQPAAAVHRTRRPGGGQPGGHRPALRPAAPVGFRKGTVMTTLLERPSVPAQAAAPDHPWRHRRLPLAAVLMFRYDQPDALMTLLLVASAYGVTRAIDDGRLRWMLVAGAAMGLNFLTKGLQPFTVLPALVLVYLVAANAPLRRRIVHLLA